MNEKDIGKIESMVNNIDCYNDYDKEIKSILKTAFEEISLCRKRNQKHWIGDYVKDIVNEDEFLLKYIEILNEFKTRTLIKLNLKEEFYSNKKMFFYKNDLENKIKNLNLDLDIKSVRYLRESLIFNVSLTLKEIQNKELLKKNLNKMINTMLDMNFKEEDLVNE